MKQRIQGRKWAVQFLIGSLLMVCAQVSSVFANDFSKYTLDTFTDDYRAYKPNEILVRFVSSSHDSTGLFTHKAVWTRLADSVLSGARVQQDMSHVISGLAVVRLPKGVSVVEAVHAFSASADVQYAEPNYRFSLCAAPADPEFPRQWALDNPRNTDINAPEGWDIQFEAVIDDEPIIVAILDTGVDFNHPDLYLNMWEMIDFVIPEDANQDDPNFDPEDPNFMVIEHGPDFIDGDESADDPNDFFADGVPWDEHYHGTMVAGIIGATANNDEGISGVAQVVKMLPIRISEGMTEEGYLADENGDLADNNVQNAVSGIGYALGAGAKVINISWTTTTYSQALYDTIQLAADANVVVVAAAGNDNLNNDLSIGDLAFPAAYPASYNLDNVISVMATDAFDQKASYSNYGFLNVDLAAPGGDGINAEFKIFSTTPRNETTPMGDDDVDENYGYDGFHERGTSFATAHVSGAVALGFAIRPQATASEMRQLISSDYAVDQLDSLAGLCVAEGRLNLAKFFHLLTPGKVTNTDTSVESLSIQDVIDDPGTQSGHEITVESGFFYMEAVDFKGMGLKLRSVEGADPNMPIISAILDDDAGLPTINIEMAKDAEVDGFIIEGGDDAGILTSASTLLINNCIIRNNQGYSGGGISIRSGHPIITNTEIINNIATREGGGINVAEWPDLVNQYANLGLPPETLADILAPFAPKLTLTDCTVSDNAVLNGWGGGIATDDSEVVIENCQITNNQASQDGGGLYCYLGETTVTASQFMNNNADWYGGAAFMDSESKTTLIHSIFDRNSALLSGGAISCLDTVYSEVLVKNCLLTNNISDSRDGAGIHCYNSSPKVSSCTVALNDCLQHLRRGGGLFCEVDSSPIVENVIFYKNSDVAVFTDDASSVPDLKDCLFFGNEADYGDVVEVIDLTDPRFATANIPGTNILYGDPLFVRGGLGNYYLSHVGAGQILDAQGKVNPAGATSPAIDASGTTAAAAELMGRSVRTDNETADGIRDVGLLDLGYHYDDPLPNQPVFLDTSTMLAVAATPANALTIEPASGPLEFKQYSQVQVKAAAVDPIQYIMTSWQIQGQDLVTVPVSDASSAIEMVLTMDESKAITAVFDTAMVWLEYSFDDNGEQGTHLPNERRLQVPRGRTVDLSVSPDRGQPRAKWSNTDNDFAVGYTNQVTMVPPFDTNKRGQEIKFVTVKLFQPRTLELRPGDSIDQAVAAAQPGDIIRLHESPTPYYTQAGFNIVNRNITITGTDPEDPNVVANTVIEYSSGDGLARPAFVFRLTEPNMILEGFTLRGFNRIGLTGADGDIQGNKHGAPGNSVMGGVIVCDWASPTIRNVVIEGCSVTGGLGGNGDDGDINEGDPIGGDGGWPGSAAGGAISCHFFSNPLIENCIFRDCSAAGGSGGEGGDGDGDAGGIAGGWIGIEMDNLASQIASGWTFSPTELDYLSATSGVGGAVYVDKYSSPRFQSCVFEDCNATGGVMGINGLNAGVAGQGSDPISIAYSIDTAGGAVYVGGARAVDIADYNRLSFLFPDLFDIDSVQAQFVDCEFTSNQAVAGINLKEAFGSWGGAVAVSADPAEAVKVKPLFKSCTMSGNDAQTGGAIYSDGSRMTIDECQVEDNVSFRGGGAYLALSEPVVRNSVFTGNIASTDPTYLIADPNATLLGDVAGEGGALVLADSNATVVDSQIQLNNAEAYGGGIYVVGTGEVTLTNCLISGNQSGRQGGGLSGVWDSRSIIRGCTITENTAIAMGGGLFVAHYGYAELTDSVVWDNSAAQGGGVASRDDGGVWLDSTRLVSNQANTGGALFASSSNIVVNKAIVRENVALGGTQSAAYDALFAFGYLQTNPSTAGLGGGFMFSDTSVVLKNSEFIKNRSEGLWGRGGALAFYDGDKSIAVTNSLFAGNQAQQDGGIVWVDDEAQTSIRNSTFVNGQAGHLGGALYASGESDVSLVDNVFQNNAELAVVETNTANVQMQYNLFDSPEPHVYGRLDGTGSVLTRKTVSDLDMSNMAGDPLFVPGPLGDYYLRQVRGGDDEDSPAVDSGSAAAKAVGLEVLTTATNAFLDAGAVDLGYHRVNHSDLPRYALTIEVLAGQGTIAVNPNDDSGLYYAGSIVSLEAKPGKAWTVGAWSGTANDSGESRFNYVVMDSNQVVTMAFNQQRVLRVSDYTSIQGAIDDANNGDIVLLPSGPYNVASGFLSDLVLDKPITLSSEHPDSADVTLSTFVRNANDIIITHSDVVLEGLTFRNSQGSINVVNCSPTIRNCRFYDCVTVGGAGVAGVLSDGSPGESVQGGVLTVFNGSPKILDCFFSNCSVTGGIAGDGDAGDAATHPDGFDGGWGGYAYGGAAYIGYNSKPYFEDCHFEGCAAVGGTGGNGGAAVAGAIGGRGGNFEWLERETPGSLPLWDWWDGWDSAPYDENGAPALTPPTFYRPSTRWTGLGGAVYCESEARPTFVKCTFNGNEAYGCTSGVGGAMAGSPNANIPNRALKIPTYGGSVYAVDDCVVTFVDCRFEDSLADSTLDPNAAVAPLNEPDMIYKGYGGAVASDWNSRLVFEGCSFKNCESGQGGAVYLNDSTLSLTDSDITDCQAYHGGAIYARESQGTIVDARIRDNRAQYIQPDPLFTDPNDPNTIVPFYDPGYIFGKGGGIFLQESAIDIVDSVLRENMAAASGGAVYYAGHSGDQLSNLNLNFNTEPEPVLPPVDTSDEEEGNGKPTPTPPSPSTPATPGPALIAPRLHNCLITDNTAVTDGGGLAVHWLARLRISNTTIAENRVLGGQGSGAGLGGGLSVNFQAQAQVVDSIIWNNQGVDGAQIAVGTANEQGDWSSSLDISHTTIGPDYEPNGLPMLALATEQYEQTVVELEQRLLRQQQQVATNAARLVEGQTITNRFEAGAERVDVIVTLAFNSTDVKWDTPASVTQHRADVARKQASFLSGYPSDAFTTTYHYQNIAAVAGKVTRSAMNSMLNNPMVAHIEPVRQVRVLLKNALSLGNAAELRHAYSGKNVAIAVVDSGVDYTHPMLGGGDFPNDKVIGGYDVAEMDGDPMPVVEPHGTAVSGIAAGSLGEYGDYIGGVAYDAKIYALKIGLDDGSIPTDAGLAAWDWCLTHRNDDPANPIKVITNSWGASVPINNFQDGDNYSPAGTRIARELTDAGITILAGSGNDGFIGEVAWPAGMSDVISVGALHDVSGQVMTYSDTADILDIFAPADPVYTTDMVGLAGYTGGDYTSNFNGTSSACPFVAGAVACLQDAAQQHLDRYLTPFEVRAMLVETGDPVRDIKADITKPRLNLARALSDQTAWPIQVALGSQINGWQAETTARYDSWQSEWDANSLVLTSDPLFVDDFYLATLSAGHDQNSPAIDMGSLLASDVALDVGYTPYSTGDLDAALVDMGYHHLMSKMARLVVLVDADGVPVLDHDIYGTVAGGNRVYLFDEVVTLVADPTSGYKVKQWQGTDDDASTRNTNVVSIDRTRVDENGTITVTVEFEEAGLYQYGVAVAPSDDGLPHGVLSVLTDPIDVNNPNLVFDGSVLDLEAKPDEGYELIEWTNADFDDATSLTNTLTVDADNILVQVRFKKKVETIISVPGDHDTLQKAISAANSGDTIVLDSGIYQNGENQILAIINKPLTIRSTNPEDPCVVAATILDGYLADGNRQFSYLGMMFTAGADSSTVLNGITIQNCGGTAVDGDDGDRAVLHPDGSDGGPIFGGAIQIMPHASPTIKNCIFRNNVILAGNGGNGVGGDATNNAGRGGWGGWARGGAIYCAAASSPTFINCQILDNSVRGGDGGNGGDGTADSSPNYGGNYSPGQAIQIDSTGLLIQPIVGELWQQWNWDFYQWYQLVLGENAINVGQMITAEMIINDPNLLASLSSASASIGPYLDHERAYTGLGGGVFCDTKSHVRFVDCLIQGNRSFGGLTGIGGVPDTVTRNIEPLYAVELPSYGGGVYCGPGSTVEFDGCTFDDNIASSSTGDPNGTGTGVNTQDRPTAYMGYGGGVCADRSTQVEFVDCRFVDNQADSGGGLFVRDVPVEVRDCNFVNNEALQGAALAGTGGEILISDCDVMSNRAITDVDDPNDDLIIPSGGGFFLDNTNARVVDSRFQSNFAIGSGGGLYLRGEAPQVINCLFAHNGAGRDGGAISTNLFALTRISNCTFTNNLADADFFEGSIEEAGYGGAVYSGSESICTITNSILWGNDARLGHELAVAARNSLDESCGIIRVSYSNVSTDVNDVYVDCDSLSYGAGMLHTDPGFTSSNQDDHVIVQRGDYYLAPDSWCVDAGSTTSYLAGVSHATTHTSLVRDSGRVDMGYHYSLSSPCSFGDLVKDGIVDSNDLAYVTQEIEKGAGANLRADVTVDGTVDSNDLDFITVCLGVSDTEPPLPDAAEWEQEPIADNGQVMMSAEIAKDGWWGDEVQYFFDCVNDDNLGTLDSGWIDQSFFAQSALTNRSFTYRVKVRDASGNETEWSEVLTTGPRLDGAPTGPLVLDANDVGISWITLLGRELSSEGDVQYNIDIDDDIVPDTGWFDYNPFMPAFDPNLLTYFVDVNDPNGAPGPFNFFYGLEKDTTYRFRLMARDAETSIETNWSQWFYFTTLDSNDVTPPIPNPMAFDTAGAATTDTYYTDIVANATQVNTDLGITELGSPVAVVDPNFYVGTSGNATAFTNTDFMYVAVMAAILATDEATEPVEYFFECNDPRFNSGWVLDPTYIVRIGRKPFPNTMSFRVRARDQAHNETMWSEWVWMP